MGIASSYRQPAAALILQSPMSVPTATIGRVCSTRAIRASRTAWSSIQAMWTGAATLATMVALSAQSAHISSRSPMLKKHFWADSANPERRCREYISTFVASVRLAHTAYTQTKCLVLVKFWTEKELLFLFLFRILLPFVRNLKELYK